MPNLPVRRPDPLPFRTTYDCDGVYAHVAIEPTREILRRYHPREPAYASLCKVPESPKDLPGSPETK